VDKCSSGSRNTSCKNIKAVQRKGKINKSSKTSQSSTQKTTKKKIYPQSKDKKKIPYPKGKNKPSKNNYREAKTSNSRKHSGPIRISKLDFLS